MTVPEDDIEFDRLLTEALVARPEHRSMDDVAQRAMHLAIAEPVSNLGRSAVSLSPQAIAKLARLRRRSRIVAVAASLLIGLMIALGVSRVVNGGYLNDALGLSTTDSTSTSTTAGTTATSLSLGVVLTGEILLVALFLLTFAGLQRPNNGPAAELAMW